MNGYPKGTVIAELRIGSNREKIIEAFTKEPLKRFQLRELSRKTRLGLPTVKKHVVYLNKKNILRKEKEGMYHHYEANVGNKEFKIIKTAHTLINIGKAVEEIVDKVRPNTIVLFGSAAKGEDTEKSDIDVFVQARRRSFEFSSIERKLNRGEEGYGLCLGSLSRMPQRHRREKRLR